MKISKSLLQAIVVGLTLGTTASSCELFEKEQIHHKSCHENCQIYHTVNPELEPDNCPACGMG
jgi:hypothetical protein